MDIGNITAQNSAISYSRVNQTAPVSNSAQPDDKNTDATTSSTSETSQNTDPKKNTKNIDEKTLTEQELKEIEKLKSRDLEVKAHELAHVAAGGKYIQSSINYQYQTGPDGKRYAIGGDVSIDISAVAGDPLETVKKMQTVQRAALAPASPSSADLMVAAKAGRLETQARIDASIQQAKSLSESSSGNESALSAKSASDEYLAQAEGLTPSEKGQQVDFAV